MNKNIGTIILIVLLIVFIGISGYLYIGVGKCKTQALQCRDALTGIQQLCAPYLPTE